MNTRYVGNLPPDMFIPSPKDDDGSLTDFVRSRISA